MNIARVLYPVEVLGPGERIGIWLCGCNRKCKGCSNPELWEPNTKYEITVGSVMALIKRIASEHHVEGFTISGGEPMDQAHELADLIAQISMISEDILVYTGYVLKELYERKDLDTETILSKIAVLIDGEYIEDRNDNSMLRGSNNQQIHFLNPFLEEKYQDYLAFNHNQIQNFTTYDGVISVGIHRKGFSK